MLRPLFAAAWMLLFCTVVATPTQAQSLVWPSQTIKILVGFPAGSTPDMAARALAQPLSKRLGQPVIIENRLGASGNIAADAVAKANDAYTLGVVINGNLTSAKLLNPTLAFDPAKDLSLISLLAVAPLALVVPVDLPPGKEFFAAAAKSAGQWNYGSVGVGSVGHLGMELLSSKVPGLQAVHIPFAGNPQIVTAMLGGQIQAALMPPAVAMSQVRAGKLRMIGLAGPRSVLAPEAAPLSEVGVQGLELEVWTALVGPAKLQPAVLQKLSDAVTSILRESETRQRLFAAGWQAVGTSPAGLQVRVVQETKTMQEIITARAIKLD